MKRRAVDLLSGILIGAALFGGGYAAAASGVMAVPTWQPIYVDGQQVQMKAYNINGNNYFKLRDLAQLLDFQVEWQQSSRSILLDTTKTYSPA